ncbi:acyl-CoA-binding protein [Myroides ceti]|uniref:Acyl-CoA-binding protein n=1 Tax=Paenimyroides ceti TaxID=395087 RepID=A0ABT8CUK2_9FLAO|nr:acyl-CoA-binding protein [Paenimyroides ceti]MDN3707831.1 acyl-CoA-binding protein [Paenimyroides ceti]
MDDQLNKEFLEAYKKASSTDSKIPSDVKLRIYAYYKQATSDTLQMHDNQQDDLVKAFKFNAWMQISHLTSEQAKIEYINLIKSLEL